MPAKGDTRMNRFHVECLYASAIGIIENVSDKKFIKESTPLTEREKKRIDTAIEVFKKLTPSNVNLGGQPGNPIDNRITLTWEK